MEKTYEGTMVQDAYSLELGLIVALAQRDAKTDAREIGMTKTIICDYLRERQSQYSYINKKWEPFWYFTHTLPFYQAMRDFFGLFQLPELNYSPSTAPLKWHALKKDTEEIEADLSFEIKVDKHVRNGRNDYEEAKDKYK